MEMAARTVSVSVQMSGQPPELVRGHAHERPTLRTCQENENPVFTVVQANERLVLEGLVLVQPSLACAIFGWGLLAVRVCRRIANRISNNGTPENRRDTK